MMFISSVSQISIFCPLCSPKFGDMEMDKSGQVGERRHTRDEKRNELIIGGLVLGSAYLAACVFSVPAILLGKGRLWGLKALNWGLVVLVVATLLVSRPTHPNRHCPSTSREELSLDGITE